MTPQVDDQFLSAMGLAGLPEEQKQQALENIISTLNYRVGARVSDGLTEEQLDKFESLLSGDAANEDAISQWLAQNVPNYEQIVGEEAQKMKDEASSMVDQVMAKKDASLSDA